MHKLRVGVIRGGPSNEYDVSLNTGATVLSALRDYLDHRYHIHDILIDRDGMWHIDGSPFLSHSLPAKIDVAFNALHGAYGEDGKIQAFLETHGVPFTGSGSLGSAVGMNKVLSKHMFKSHGIKSPYWIQVASDGVREDSQAVAQDVFSKFVFPAVVKPSASGSSVGVYVVRTYQELLEALVNAAQHGDTLIIEEFVPGVEATCGVIEGYRNQELYVLPPIEIRPHSSFFDYEAKYAGKSEEIVPATFDESTKKSLEELASKVHKALGLRHYSRTDFIIHPRRGIYVLETNTLPGLTAESLVPKALRAVGGTMHDFVDHLITLATRHQSRIRHSLD